MYMSEYFNTLQSVFIGITVQVKFKMNVDVSEAV